MKIGIHVINYMTIIKLINQKMKKTKFLEYLLRINEFQFGNSFPYVVLNLKY